MAVCLLVWVCESYVLHHFMGTGLRLRGEVSSHPRINGIALMVKGSQAIMKVLKYPVSPSIKHHLLTSLLQRLDKQFQWGECKIV